MENKVTTINLTKEQINKLKKRTNNISEYIRQLIEQDIENLQEKRILLKEKETLMNKVRKIEEKIKDLENKEIKKLEVFDKKLDYEHKIYLNETYNKFKKEEQTNARARYFYNIYFPSEEFSLELFKKLVNKYKVLN